MTSPWWRDAVIYQVYVRSFADGNGDGVGDLLGARTRLPYLRDLGVDALWLTPFYKSPMADGGYDVADYRDVDPTLGTLGDITALVAEAHAQGLRVIVDIVPNHTSDQHAWFQDPAMRDRYIFREGVGDQPPNDWESVFGGPAWTRVEDGSWYLHLFASEQPDLNWHHPEVRAEFASILRYWLDLGVDGFRIDVAHGMFKDPEFGDIGREGQIKLLTTDRLPYFDRDEVHEVYREWRKITDSYEGERMLVAEAWVPDATRLARYVRPDELHNAFNFHYLSAGWSCAELRKVIDESITALVEVGAPPTWVLSNHDVRRHLTRYGSLEKARAAALLMLALPGSAYVYQGEELGLPEVLDLPVEVLQDPQYLRSGDLERGRDGCRVPLPWGGAEAPFGFGPLGSDATWLPQPSSWVSLSVEAQTGVTGSTLELYRTALSVRREVDGELVWLDTPGDVLAFTRDDFVCVVNFGSSPVAWEGELLVASQAVVDGLIPSDTTAWFRVS